MKKKFILFFIMIILVTTGCQTQSEENKSEYIALKNETFDEKNYKETDINVDITTTIERLDEEAINYEVIINNPKENMHNIKAMVVHNYYSENIFPTIGVFDNTEELLINTEDSTNLKLKDTIKTTENISKLDLEFKIWIEYTDDSGKTKDIYYKTTV